MIKIKITFDKVATDIKTEDWNNILEGLIKEDWVVVSKYDALDAGIDFDFLILEKNKQRILFRWDNWLEREIKCSSELMYKISNKFGIEFKFGELQYLTKVVVGITRFQNWYNNLKKR